MGVRARIKKVVKWLIGEGYANNQKEVGRLLGYANESAFSQVLNGHVDLPADFIPRICSLDDRLNIVWLQSGEGEMLNGNSKKQQAAEPAIAVNIPAEVWEVIKAQAFSLKTKDEQMGQLIAQVEESNSVLRTVISANFRPFEGIHTKLDTQNPPPHKTRRKTLIMSKKGQFYIIIPTKENTIKS